MKLVSNRFSILCAVLGLASFLNFSAQAQMSVITDATGEISPNLGTTGDGTLDIVKMEVGDTATDVVFRLTINGNVSTTGWGKFMIGMANGKGGATGGTKSGNGWSRPINLDAGTSGGMTHWIGSWVDGGNGANFFTYSGTAWTETAATYSGNFPGFSVVAGAQSVITYTVPKASLGVVNGDTIRFDAYSSGGGTPDSAVDALANPNTSITGWGGPYTSSGANLASYTLANTMLNTTQAITFSANMNHQIVLGTFNPATDAVTVDWGAGFPSTNFAYLTDGDEDGIYTGTATISAVGGASVPFRFTIEPVDIAAPLVSETVNRSFSMPNAAATISSLYFNNIEGYRDVTFSANMSVQQTLGNFNPATQTVEVRGPFNDWAGTALTAQGSGIYSGTVRVSGAAGPIAYKFYSGSYEGVSGNRSFNLAFNSDRAPTPAQVLDTVFYSNVNTVPDFRPVAFAANMNQQISLGRFNPATDFLEIRGGMNSWGGGTTWRLADGDSDGIYTGTFNIEGTAAATVEYKFYNTALGIGYETTPNRTLVLGPVQTPQTASTVYFNNDSGQTRQVTFAVDMSVQAQIGNFNPATGVVQLRGLGGFGDTQAQALTREGTTLTYSGTFAVPGDSTTDFAYKFWATGATFEVINPNDTFINRTLTLGASGTPQTAPTVFFSNVSLPPPSGLSYTPSSASGTVGTAITSLNPSVTGTVTSYSVSPALPFGLSLDASSGVISGTPTAVSALDTYTVTAANGTGTTTATVMIEVSAPAGSTFAGAYPGASMTDVAPNGLTYLANYAFGGTETTPATLPVQDTSDPTKLRLVVVFRTDDSTLSLNALGGETTADLAGGWSASGVSVENSTDLSPTPANTVRKVISVDRGSDPKKFLRATITK
jgi:hypothetical protein